MNKKSAKLIISLALVFVILILSIIAYIVLKNKHYDEINKVIKSNNGKVEKITEVSSENSPYKGNSGKGNVIYNVIYNVKYMKDGKLHTAWYRAINNPIDINNPAQRTLDSNWIFEEP